VVNQELRRAFGGIRAILHAERLKRILDRGHDRWRRDDDAGLARALHTERIVRRRRFPIRRRQFGQLGRGGQQIIGEGCRRRLTGLVVAHPFEQRVADAVRDRTARLSCHGQRIDAHLDVSWICNEKSAAGRRLGKRQAWV